MNALKLAPVIVLFFCNFGKYVHEVINQNVVNNCVKNKVFTELLKRKGMYEFVNKAAEPDNRKKVDHNERYKHFFHVDAYDHKFTDYVTYDELNAIVFEKKDSEVYKGVKDVEQYMKNHGRLPWAIIETIDILKNYVKERKIAASTNSKDTNIADLDKKILDEAINLAHYISDLCTPLHLTKNYDGKYNSQKGIHSLWETGIPRLFLKTYTLKARKLDIGDINNYIFKLLDKGSALADEIIKSEDDIFNEYRVVNKKIYYKKRFVTKKYTRLCAKYYNKQINEQINLAISLIVHVFNNIVFV